MTASESDSKRPNDFRKTPLYLAIERFLILLPKHAVELYQHKIVFSDDEIIALRDIPYTATRIYNAIPPQLLRLCETKQPSIEDLWLLPRVTPSAHGVGVMGILFKSDSNIQHDEEDLNNPKRSHTRGLHIRPVPIPIGSSLYAYFRGGECEYFNSILDFTDALPQPDSAPYHELKGVVLTRFETTDAVGELTHIYKIIPLTWRVLTGLFGLLGYEGEDVLRTFVRTGVPQYIPEEARSAEMSMYARIAREAASQSNWHWHRHGEGPTKTDSHPVGPPAYTGPPTQFFSTSSPDTPTTSNPTTTTTVPSDTTTTPNTPKETRTKQTMISISSPTRPHDAQPFHTPEFRRMQHAWIAQPDARARENRGLGDPREYVLKMEREYFSSILSLTTTEDDAGASASLLGARVNKVLASLDPERWDEFGDGDGYGLRRKEGNREGARRRGGGGGFG